MLTKKKCIICGDAFTCEHDDNELYCKKHEPKPPKPIFRCPGCCICKGGLKRP